MFVFAQCKWTLIAVSSERYNDHRRTQVPTPRLPIGHLQPLHPHWRHQALLGEYPWQPYWLVFDLLLWFQFLVNGTMVTDKPRFSHRGVLLDTSRHFIHKDIIKQNLVNLSFNKKTIRIQTRKTTTATTHMLSNEKRKKKSNLPLNNGWNNYFVNTMLGDRCRL